MHARRRHKNQVQFIVLHVLVLAVETRCSCMQHITRRPTGTEQQHFGVSQGTAQYSCWGSP